VIKKLLTYSFLFSLGLIIGLLFLWNSKKSYQTQQIDVITNGIKNVSKLIVTEASFSEIYNYKDAKKYLFEYFEFEKQVILLVDAKVLGSYDLRKLDIEIDSIHNKIILHKIPKEKLDIIPTYKYYDFQQSVWNTFTKEELNKIQKNSLENLVSTIAISSVKEKAKNQLIKEIKNILLLAKLVDWEVIDKTETSFLEKYKNTLKT